MLLELAPGQFVPSHALLIPYLGSRRIPFFHSCHVLSSVQQGLRQHILGITPGVGFLGHLPLDDIGWNQRVVSTTDASPSRVPTFRSDVFCCLRSCTLHRAPCSTGERCTGSTLPEGVGLPTPGASTVLVKLVSPSQLAYLNDGSIVPSIHSLLREHFALATRFRLLPLRTHGVLASHPASWIDVQSLPRGCSFPTPVHRVRTCTSHHHISCVKASFYPSIPKRGSFFRTNVSHSST
jgi:hypothetical protein